MKTIRSLSFALLLASSTVFGSGIPEQFKSDDVIETANKALGVVEKVVELEAQWSFVKGSKDSFLMSRDGRFAITVEAGVLSLSDIWQQKAIRFDELNAARFVIPLEALGFLPDGKRAPLMHFRLGKGEVKATLFGDPFADAMKKFVRSVDWDNAGFSVNYYPLPQNEKSWLKFACTNRSIQQALIEGEELDIPETALCDKKQAMMQGGSLATVAKFVGIKSFPFSVRHSDWKAGPAPKNFVEHVEQ